jgi:3-deoxy-manno-octulosonate cytidylyltransferase (CMP-KDO synthetase)
MRAKVIAVIPARLNSRRFPRKVVCPFQGKPLLYYVWNGLRQAKRIDRLLIATDNPEVAEVSESFGAEVIRTSSRHRTGSDRVAEVMRKTGGEIFVNVQADNFGLKAGVLDRVLEKMKKDRETLFATLARRIDGSKTLSDPCVVKVVMTRQGRALWFSRYPIPYLQHGSDRADLGSFPFLEHIGIYFFRRRALAAYSGWKRSPIEKAESLEQLRVLENGGSMKVFVTRARSVSVDTPRDVRKLDRL